MAYSSTETRLFRQAIRAAEAEARAAHQAMMREYARLLEGAGPGPTAEQVADSQALSLAADALRRGYLARLDELSIPLISLSNHSRDERPLG